MKLTDLTENQAVHCATKEEAKRICKIAHDNGLKWNTGRTYIGENNWEEYKEETCYNFNLNVFESLYYYKKEGYEIIPSTKITEEPKPKTELKKVWAWDVNPNNAFQTYLIKEMDGFEYKYLCVAVSGIESFEEKDFIRTSMCKNISETDPRLQTM